MLLIPSSPNNNDSPRSSESKSIFFSVIGLTVICLFLPYLLYTGTITLPEGVTQGVECNLRNKKDDNKVSLDIPHLHEMDSHSLRLSYHHQLKFFTLKDKFMPWLQNTDTSTDINNEVSSKRMELNRKILKPHNPNGYFSFILNDEYAYRHIFKSGGTTMAYQTFSTKHKTRDEIGERKLMTVIRDPLDHFLSGWAECGFRLNLHNTSAYDMLANENSYDVRVQKYLQSTITCLVKEKDNHDVPIDLCRCSTHSHPQFQYFLFQNGDEILVDPKLRIVGDMMELESVSELTGFTFNRPSIIGRNAEDNVIKKTHFPKSIDLLSNSTLQNICDFVLMDYIAFDFEPPSLCREQIESDIMSIMKEER